MSPLLISYSLRPMYLTHPRQVIWNGGSTLRFLFLQLCTKNNSFVTFVTPVHADHNPAEQIKLGTGSDELSDFQCLSSHVSRTHVKY